MPLRQAAAILLSVTYNLHSGVYGVRGGRSLIRDPWINLEVVG